MGFKVKKRIFNKVERFIISAPLWALRLGFILVLIPIVIGGLRACQGDIDPPSADKAPWVIQTYIYSDNFTARVPSRFYLGEYYSTIDGTPALKGYWDYDGKTYEYHNEIKEFPPDEYGPVDIIRRK